MPGIFRKSDYSYSASQRKTALEKRILSRFGVGRKVSRVIFDRGD
jgi:hypothetical protein